jgi:hypothetical protein
MNNLFEYDLFPDPDLDSAENIFLVSIYIREEININSSFTLQIPKFIFESLNKSDFNIYFSDLLLAANFLDKNMKIEIKDASYFRLTLNQ